MDHQDAEITEMVIIMSRSCEGRLGDAVETLKKAGVDVISVDEDEFVVNGTIDAGKLGELQKLECVNYVRVVDTYIAERPIGSPTIDDEPGEED